MSLLRRYYYYLKGPSAPSPASIESVGGGATGGAPSTAGEAIGLLLVLTKAS